MYLIGVFIKTRQLFLNKNSSVIVRLCERQSEGMTNGAASHEC